MDAVLAKSLYPQLVTTDTLNRQLSSYRTIGDSLPTNDLISLTKSFQLAIVDSLEIEDTLTALSYTGVFLCIVLELYKRTMDLIDLAFHVISFGKMSIVPEIKTCFLI
jgi:hypothetical protein